MKETLNNDNKYVPGTFIYAKAFPAQKLIIDAYKQRIYYCSAADSAEAKQFVYFEGELLPPER
jgi:hypothetical protein